MKSTKLPRKVLLEYLDKYSLGYAATRKERIAIKMRFNNQQEVLKENINKFSKGGYNKNLKLNNVEDDTEILPYPFNKAPNNVTKIASINTKSTLDNFGPTFPEFNSKIPEIAVIGRSNVGKSSLINALLNFNDSFEQKCAFSDSPGETKSLNFYTIGTGNYSHDTGLVENSKNHKFVKPKSLIITDLPGYGFSYIPENEIKILNSLMTDYLLRNNTRGLRRVLLLIDARHGFKKADYDFLSMLSKIYHNNENTHRDDNKNDINTNQDKKEGKQQDNKYPKEEEEEEEEVIPFRKHSLSWKLQIVLTKCDLLERKVLARTLQETMDNLDQLTLGLAGSTNLSVLCTSLKRPGPSHRIDKKGKRYSGLDPLRRELAALLPRNITGYSTKIYDKNNNRNNRNNHNSNSNSNNNSRNNMNLRNNKKSSSISSVVSGGKGIRQRRTHKKKTY